jgi:hypothetical protein
MKTLIFKIKKSTKEEIDEAVIKNKGQPWMYTYHVDYWMNDKMILQSDGTFVCSGMSRIDELINFIEKKERLL